MTKKKIAIIDLDYVLHAAASVGEERYVEVTHTPSGRVKEFKNKSEFCGKNTKGGWLKGQNEVRLAKGLDPFPLESFEIVPKQRITEPLPNILHSAKRMVEAALKASKATCYEAFLGYGDSHRVAIAKMQKYKGNREDMLRPLMLDDVKEYLRKKFDAVCVEGIEVDDMTVIRCKELLDEGEDAFVLAIDKDAMGCPIKVYNPNKPEQGIVDCRGFGELVLDSKGKVRGRGRIFKYWQIAYGDRVDGYSANARSEVRWGEKSAYKALVACKDDKEAWTTLVSVFKRLYPKPVTFDSWDGDTYTYDWLDALQEMADMAHMKTHMEDRLLVEEQLLKYGVQYDR